MQKYSNETEFIFSNEFIGFTTIPNYILNDKRLSFKALGLYVQILQFQNSQTHKIYIKSLSQLKKDGRDSVSSGIKELLEAGYLHREQLRDEAGRLNGYRYTVFMKPQKPNEIDIPARSGVSRDGEADNCDSDNGEPVTKKKIGKKKISKKDNKSFIPSETERMTDFNNDFRTQIEQQVDKETLDQEQDPLFVEELINNICEMNESNSIRVGNRDVPQSIVRKNIAQLRYRHLDHVARAYNEACDTTTIKNVRGYLQSMLYNSIYEANAKLTNEIRSKGLA